MASKFKDGAVPGIPRLYFLSISARLFFEAPIRFTLSSSAKIVVIFQVSEVLVMRKKNRSVLLMSLFSASLLVCAFTIVQAQNPGATAAKATKWSDAATWPNRKVPVAGDKVTIDAGKAVVLDVNTQAQYDFMRQLYQYLYPANPEFHITDTIRWYDEVYRRRTP